MGEDTTSNPSPEGVAVTDTGFKLHNARATTAHQTPPPHLSALMLLVDNYTIVGHARKYHPRDSCSKRSTTPISFLLLNLGPRKIPFLVNICGF